MFNSLFFTEALKTMLLLDVGARLLAIEQETNKT